MYDGTDLVAVATVNFSAAFSEALAGGAIFDPETLRVHEVDAAGTVVNTEVAFQFDPDLAYDAGGYAAGELIIALAGSTTANLPRHFAVYFEEFGISTTPVTVSPVLTVDPFSVDEGVGAVLVSTSAADFYFDQAGGGFSSIVDPDGNDWINFSTTPGSAGEFRGTPNLVYPEGYFHPGSTAATTTVTSTGPLRASLLTTTGNGWSMRWEFFASHARGTVVAAPSNYWFLYEGTPGGQLDAADIVIQPDGTVTNAMQGSFDADLVGAEWVAFADPGVGRSLVVTNNADDNALDSYVALNDEMTVFGFGRDGLGRRLNGVDRSFTVGLTPAIDHALIEPTALTAHTPPVATVGIGENQGLDTYGVDVAVVGAGSVTRDPDQPSYADGSVVQLSALADPGESFVGWSGDVTSTETVIDVTVSGAPVSVTATFSTSATGSGFVSDDFDAASLAAQWAFVDPVGDSTATLVGAGSDQATVEIAVPAGVSHDAYGVNDSARLMQPIADADFELEAAFLTSPTERYQINGLLVQQGPSTWLRYDLFHDGTNLRVHASQTAGNTSTTVLNSIVAPTTRFLRLQRTNDTWAGEFSEDGATWTTAGSFTFPLAPISAGVFAGNAGPSPAYTAVVDYVFETQSPIVPEDGTTTYAVSADIVGGGAVTKSPDQAFYVDGAQVQLVATPDEGETFLGWSGDVTSNASSITVTVSGAPIAVVASFSETAGTSGFISDDFNSLSLGGQWSFDDPVGDSTVTIDGVGSGQAVAEIAVPGGTEHDAFGINNSARLMQPVADENFVLEVGFDSVPTLGYQLNGLLVEQDPQNWLRFDVFHTGSELHVHAGAALSGVASTYVNQPIAGDTKFLRLERSGDSWTGYSSTDGVNWTLAGAFTVPLNVTAAGVFAGNAGADPAYTARVDYVFETATPVSPEDPPFDAYPIDVVIDGGGSVVRSPDQGVYADGSVVTLTATADAGETFTGWSGDATSPQPSIEVTVNGGPISLVASFSSTANSSGFASDDFNSEPLASHWSFVDPVGDSTLTLIGADTGQAVAQISVPAGSGHDAWSTNNSARLMQPISDVDFELEAAFDGSPATAYQFTGLLVEQGPSDWLRYDLVHDGTGLFAFAGTTTAGTSTTRFKVPVPTATRFVQLTRSGNTWTGRTSTDGTNWVARGTFNFAAVPAEAGVFVGNAGPKPAFSVGVDYVFDVAAPIAPEDGSNYAITTDIVGDGSVSRSPDQTSYADGTVVTLTAIPDDGDSFVGWTGDVESTALSIDITIADSPVGVVATFTSTVESSNFASDDFNTSELAAQWTFVDPVGDSAVSLTGFGTGQATADISLGGGSSHDPWHTNKAARLMQPIDDVDFELQAAFAGVPSFRNESTGLVVEQDSQNWLRFDVVHDGNGLFAFAATTLNGTSTSRFKVPVPNTTQVLRLTRSGTTWTGFSSSDGVTWAQAGSFVFALNAADAGFFVGNVAPSSGYTVTVDYVIDTATPIDPEDGGIGYEIDSSVTGDGSVTRSPDQATYLDGSTVQLTAQPVIGGSFTEWTGDVTSTEPTIDVTIDGAPVAVTANFAIAPPSYPIEVETVGNGSISRSPDNETYLSGTVVTLSANPDVGESFVGWSGDIVSTAQNINVTVDDQPVDVTATFTQSVSPSGFVSDDFDVASLDSRWTFVDPVGDASVTLTGHGTGDAVALLSVPAGAKHDAFGPNNSARIMQAINDTDFELEAAFENAPAERYELSGLLIEQDATNWLRFDAYHDGNGLHVYAGATANGSTSTKLRVTAPTDTRFFRLNRTGDNWTAHFSSDGQTWAAAGSFGFALDVTAAGVFAGNAGPNPAYTARVDYVFETANPIIPEDNSFVAYPVDVTIAGDGVVVKNPNQSVYADGSVVELSASPSTGSTFAGWTGDVVSTASTITVVVDGSAPSVTATFQTSASGFRADDFNNASLGDQWVFVDPRGDASFTFTGTGTGDASIELSVPGGVAHDAFGSTNNAARIMQPVIDTNFELQVSFDELPSSRFQANGLLVEQDSTNWIRFDTFHDDTNLNVYAAATINGQTTTRFNVVAAVDANFLRLDRTGDTWTGYYSADGVTWAQAGDFILALAPTSAGVFVANAGPSPAYSAVVDYVLETSAPITNEDAASAYPVTVSVTGDGSVVASPQQSVYTPGSVVSLTATPDVDESFLGWSGAVTSGEPTIEVIIGNEAVEVNAAFSTGAQSYPVTATTSGNGTVTRNPDQQTYTDGSLVELTAVPATGETFIGWTGDIESTDLVIEATVNGGPVAVAAAFSSYVAASGFVSDDFDDQLLGEQWTFIDPVANSSVTTSGAGTGQAITTISVPAGTAHDAFGANNNAARIMQAVTDINFELEVGFESTPSKRYQSNGFIVEQDSTNWLRFDVFHDGVALRVYGARTVFGNTSSQFNLVAPAGTRYLRLNRTGDTFTGSYSSDGLSWTVAGTIAFAMTPTSAGVYAGNAGASPAYSAVVDYVFDTSTPIVPEDASTTHAVNTTTVGAGAVTKSPDQPAYATGTVVTLTAVPDSGETFVGWTGDIESTASIIDVTVDGAAVAVTATFTETIAGSGFDSDDFDTQSLAGQWTFIDPVGNSTANVVGGGSGNAALEIAVPAGSAHDAWGANNTSARVMQPIADIDFQLAVGFDTTPSMQFQSNGLLVEQDASNWLRFDVYSDGGSVRVFAATTTQGSSATAFNTVTPSDTKFLRLDRSGNTWTGEYSSDGVVWSPAGSFNFAIAPSSAGVFAGNAGPKPGYTAIVDFVFDTNAPVDPEDGTTTYALTTSVTGDGSVTRSPDLASYPDGTVVTLTATPDLGAEFTDWTGDVSSTSSSIDVTINGGPVNVVANFTVAPPTYPVDVAIEGLGVVTKSPNQNSYLDGTVVTLTASPDPGESFIGWSGDITSTDLTVDVTVSGAAIDATAHFSGVASGIDVWYGATQTFGDDGDSQRWINILGNASASSGITSLSYRLNGGNLQPLNVGTDLRRIYNAGDFNVEIDSANLSIGSNSVLIVMIDGDGEATTELVTANWAPTTPSMSSTVDWATATDVQDGATIVDGRWGIVDGEIRTLETGYDRTVTIGDLSWTNYEVEFPVTIHALGPGSGTPQSGEPLVGLGLRWQGHSVVSGAQPNYGFYPTGAFAWWRTNTSGNRLEIFGNNNWPTNKQSADLSFGTTYVFKARVQTVAGGTEYHFKSWEQGQPEPSQWTVQIIDDDSPTSGSLVLIAHHFDVSFGNVTVTPIS